MPLALAEIALIPGLNGELVAVHIVEDVLDEAGATLGRQRGPLEDAPFEVAELAAQLAAAVIAHRGHPFTLAQILEREQAKRPAVAGGPDSLPEGLLG